MILTNQTAFQGRKVNNAPEDMLLISSGDSLIIGNPNINIIQHCLNTMAFRQNNVNVGSVTSRALGGMTVYDIDGNQRKTGFRNPFYLGRGANSATVDQAWEGRVENFTPTDNNLVITLPSLEANTTFRIVNSGVNFTLAIEAIGITLNWYDGSGQRKQGDRFVAGGSVVEIFFATTAVAYIFGNGIT